MRILIPLALFLCCCTLPVDAVVIEPPESPPEETDTMPEHSAANPGDEIRWGDQQSFTFLTPSVAAQSTTNQLVRMARPHAETWTLTLFARIKSGIPYSAFASFSVFTGSGSAQIQVDYTLTFDSTLIGSAPIEDYATLRTPYIIAFKTVELPANSVNVTAVAAVNQGDPSSIIQVAAFIAPRFYQVREQARHMIAQAGGDASPIPGVDPSGEFTGPGDWMPPGFPAYEEGYDREVPIQAEVPFGHPLRFRR